MSQLDKIVEEIVDVLVDTNSYIISRQLLQLVNTIIEYKPTPKSEKRLKKILYQALLLPAKIKDIQYDKERNKMVIYFED